VAENAGPVAVAENTGRAMRRLPEERNSVLMRVCSPESSRMHRADHIDTVIVGGGQAGLAMSYHLRQRGREHVILEAERWRTAMRSELDQIEVPAPLPPLSIDGIRTLDLLEENIRTIIWASGYGFSFDWVKLPILDAKGTPVQQRGVTASPGVYFLGLHWMHTFRSAILSFVGRDASYLADHIDQLAL
jgi:hypothetical protein